MTPEGNVLAGVRAMLHRRGIRHLKMHGGPMMEPGISDLLLCIKGQLCWLEIKAPGKKPTALQEAFQTRWRAAGCFCGWASSVEEAGDLVTTWAWEVYAR